MFLEDADNDEESKFATDLKSLDRGKKQLKKFFKNNLGLLFSTREKVLNKFESRLFPIKNWAEILPTKPTPKLAPEPTKYKKLWMKSQLTRYTLMIKHFGIILGIINHWFCQKT